jgi:hypothetical protein
MAKKIMSVYAPPKRKQRKKKQRGLHIRKKHGPRHHMRVHF